MNRKGYHSDRGGVINRENKLLPRAAELCSLFKDGHAVRLRHKKLGSRSGCFIREASPARWRGFVISAFLHLWTKYRQLLAETNLRCAAFVLGKPDAALMNEEWSESRCVAIRFDRAFPFGPLGLFLPDRYPKRKPCRPAREPEVDLQES
jgi:hypothetical protein